MADVAGELDDGHLQSETDAEEREIVLPRPADRLDHPADAPLSEPTGDEQAIAAAEQSLGRRLIGKLITGEPFDLDLGLARNAAVNQGLLHRLVGILQVGVLADHARCAPGESDAGSARS